MRRACELALGSLLLVACGGAGAPGPLASASQTAAVSERTVAFADAGATTQGRRADGPGIEAVRAGTGLRITAYMGEQRSGGYAIRIERITRAGNELRVVARFTAPAPDAMVTMALTSPAHTVTVDESADVVVLFDTTGAERARTSPR
ncbi:MAG TPA: protease complex subunit PrcB family protein [Candidatus Limnocylindria bacterium]|nr:protease complex subunit PrcB family protein [Candidatus Limnocylindria bacterium]